MTDCADPRILTELLADRLSAAETEHWTEHLADCQSCQQSLEALAGAGELPTGDDRSQRPTIASASLSSVVDRLKFGPMDNDHGETPSEPESISPESMLRRLNQLGRYEVGGIVGQGGMGIVFQGYDQGLQRMVAIKMLQPHLSADTEMRERFSREARTAASIEHDNVVTIHDVEAGDRQPFLVMQFVTGRSLDKLIAEESPLPPERIVRWSLEIASGLAAAHASALVHRDIKPANVLIEAETNKVKITDFGLAKAVDDASLTQSGTLAGTPSFMAPEQADCAEVDHRTDLFSLGSVMYTMCAGRPPFDGTSTWQVIRQVCEQEPPPLAESRGDLPAGLIALIGLLMEKDPARRPPSAEHVVELLQRIASGESVTITPQRRQPTASGRSALGVAALLVVIGIGAAGAYGLGMFSQPVSEERPADDTITIHGRGGQFTTLTEAVASAGAGETIEIGGDQSIELTEPLLVGKELTIAGSGNVQLIARSTIGSEMILNRSSLTVRGIDLLWTEPPSESELQQEDHCAIRSIGESLRLEDCRLMIESRNVISLEQGDLELSDCHLVAHSAACLSWRSDSGSDVGLSDSILHGDTVIDVLPSEGTVRNDPARLSITQSTCSGRDLIHFNLPDRRGLRAMLSRRDGLVAIDTRQSILATESLINMTSQQSVLPFAATMLRNEFDIFIGNVVVWKGSGNLYRDDMVYAASSTRGNPRKSMRNSPTNLGEWLKLWQIEQNQSLATKIEFAETFEVDDRRHFQMKENPLAAGAVQ